MWNRPWNDRWHVLTEDGRSYKTMGMGVPAVEFSAELVRSASRSLLLLACLQA